MSLTLFYGLGVRLDGWKKLFPFYCFKSWRLNRITSDEEQNMRFYDAFHFNWMKIGLNSSAPAGWNKCGSNDYHGMVVLILDISLRNNIWIKEDYCRNSYINIFHREGVVCSAKLWYLTACLHRRHLSHDFQSSPGAAHGTDSLLF